MPEDAPHEPGPDPDRRRMLLDAGSRAVDAVTRAGSRAILAASMLDAGGRDEPESTTPTPPPRPGHDACLDGFSDTETTKDIQWTDEPS